MRAKKQALPPEFDEAAGAREEALFKRLGQWVLRGLFRANQPLRARGQVCHDNRRPAPGDFRIEREKRLGAHQSILST
jgi:hypothetical protein